MCSRTADASDTGAEPCVYEAVDAPVSAAARRPPVSLPAAWALVAAHRSHYV